MAKKQNQNSRSTHSTKGLKPPKHHSKAAALKVYWPYIPMVLLLIGGLFLNVWQPLQSHRTATLAYATEMSRGSLLSGTNTQRSSNGIGSLLLNSRLNSAAQAKANDMIDRDYWSHNTPDGKQPWVFIDAQGYDYVKAGENLAYGFATGNDTIIGWMNSPSHKANLLDSTFSEVGFGFANSGDFVGTGEETVIVALYAKPVAIATPPAPAPEPVAASRTKQSHIVVAEVAEPTPVALPDEPMEEEVEISDIEDTVAPSENTPTNTDTPVAEETSQRITIAQQLTEGNAPWIAIVLSTAGFMLAMVWLVKHFVLVRRFIIEGENFIAHHPALDLLVVSAIALAIYLTQSSGVVI